MRTASARRRRVTVTVPPGGPVDEAVLDQVAQRAAQRLRVAATRSPRPGGTAATRSDPARRPPRAPARRARRACRAPVAAGALEREQGVDQAGQTRRRRAADRPAPRASAPWRAAYSTLPSSVVTGVRSSCEASARNRRSPARGPPSEASIRLSTPVSWPISSARPASGRRRAGSAVRSISPAAAASRRSGPSPRRVSSAAASAASSTTPTPLSATTARAWRACG